MIYFAQDEDFGPIKIGFTSKSDPDERAAEMQTGNPRPIKVIFCYTGCPRMESLLHERFARARIRGEWFEPVPELLDHIDRMRGTVYPRDGSLLGAWAIANGVQLPRGGGLTLPYLRDLAERHFAGRLGLYEPTGFNFPLAR